MIERNYTNFKLFSVNGRNTESVIERAGMGCAVSTKGSEKDCQIVILTKIIAVLRQVGQAVPKSEARLVACFRLQCSH